MADFPSFDYTTSNVRDAGKIIASEMLWTDETEMAIRQAYAVANSWRDSHVIPMRSIRLSALYYLRGTPLVSAAPRTGDECYSPAQHGFALAGLQCPGAL